VIVAVFVLLVVFGSLQIILVSALAATLTALTKQMQASTVTLAQIGQAHIALLLRLTVATEKGNAINEQSALVTAEAAGIVKRTEQAAVDRILAQTPVAGGKH
jgi:hypothetical protein